MPTRQLCTELHHQQRGRGEHQPQRPRDDATARNNNQNERYAFFCCCSFFDSTEIAPHFSLCQQCHNYVHSATRTAVSYIHSFSFLCVWLNLHSLYPSSVRLKFSRAFRCCTHAHIISGAFAGCRGGGGAWFLPLALPADYWAPANHQRLFRWCPFHPLLQPHST